MPRTSKQGRSSTLYTEPERHDYLDRSIPDLHHRLIVESILRNFGIGSGARVVEIGAGAGRYTSLLLELGLTVVAIEPDPALAEKLRDRHGSDARISVVTAYPYDPEIFPPDVVAVCGFHVLHHMDEAALNRLAAVFRQLRHSRGEFRGWFFLEPNPYNPLYPLQISLRPSMRFREEKGIWVNRYGRTLGEGTDVAMGFVGYWPPGRMIAVAPPGLQRWGTRAVARISPLRAYKIIGRTHGAHVPGMPQAAATARRG